MINLVFNYRYLPSRLDGTSIGIVKEINRDIKYSKLSILILIVDLFSLGGVHIISLIPPSSFYLCVRDRSTVVHLLTLILYRK